MESNNFIAIISGFFAVIGIFVGYFISTRRYAFEKIYDLKLVCLRDFFKRVVQLKFILDEYLYFIGADTKEGSIDKRIESLNKIKGNFQEFQHKFWEEEIILDEGTADQIDVFLKKYIIITSKLSAANIAIQLRDNEQAFKDWDESFKLASSDLVKIKDILKDEFRRTLKIRSWRKICNKLLGL